MVESRQEILLRIAIEKGVLSAEQASVLADILVGARALGSQEVAVTAVAVEKGWIDARQARGLERAGKYYEARQADKAYGRCAVRAGFLDEATLRNGLNKQKLDLQRKRVLRRLPSLLLAIGALTPDEDHRVRREMARRERSKSERGDASSRARRRRSSHPASSQPAPLRPVAIAVEATNADGPISSRAELMKRSGFRLPKKPDGAQGMFRRRSRRSARGLALLGRESVSSQHEG